MHVIKNMDHVLKEFEGEFKALDFERIYRDESGKPLHPELQEVVTKWISKRFR